MKNLWGWILDIVGGDERRRNKYWNQQLKKLAEEAEEYRKKWLEELEPLQRTEKGYPDDWWLRRAEILRRSQHKCELCGKRATHVHHIVPISKGGDHSFSNLELLCETCHAMHHKSLDKLLAKRAELRAKYYTIKDKLAYRGSSRRAAIVTARSDYNCTICNKLINYGDSYYRIDYYRTHPDKICKECHKALRMFDSRYS